MRAADIPGDKYVNLGIKYFYLLNPPLCFLHLIEGVCVGETPVKQVKLFLWEKSPGWRNHISSTATIASRRCHIVTQRGVVISYLGI